MLDRPRRLRSSKAVRDMVHEFSVEKSDLVYPIFVAEGENIKEEIPSMPEIFHYSLDRLPEILDKVQSAGVKAVLYFGIPACKDDCGSEAYNRNGIVQKALRLTKEKYPDIIAIADVCLCEYTSHGHCGLTDGTKILNDESIKLIAKTALSYAEAGADIVAPSDMMDGRVLAIREALDSNGYEDTLIMAYSAKYSSAFYGPFRDAANSAPKFGDRKTYQMDYRNSKEALKEVLTDIEEGADIVMVKPALAYLDIVKTVSENILVPLATYNVSGEYSMIKAGAEKGWIDEKAVVMESVTAMKRAGAKIIITYHAIDIANWLNEK